MRALLSCLLITITALAGCSASDSDERDGSSSQTGTVGFAITDAPTDDFTKVEVTISRVAIHRSGGDSDSNGTSLSTTTSASSTDSTSATATTTSNASATFTSTSDAPSSGWITLVSEANTVDLLALHRNNTAETLGFATVEAGHYQQVRFYIDSVVGTKADGSKVNMTVPSGFARTSGSFTVTAGGNTTITVDIDLDRSISCNNNSCRFQPHLGRIQAAEN